MFDGFIYVPYGLFVLLVGLAFLGVEHVFVDVVHATIKVVDWVERRRSRQLPGNVIALVDAKGEPVMQNSQNEKARRFLNFRSRR